MGDARSPVLAFKLAKLIPLLASANGGEALATARAIGRTLQAAGSDFHSLAKTVREPKTIVVYGGDDEPEESDEAEAPTPKSRLEIALLCRTRHCGRLNDKERRFIADVLAHLTMKRRLTDKQERWLLSIHYKLGGEP